MKTNIATFAIVWTPEGFLVVQDDLVYKKGKSKPPRKPQLKCSGGRVEKIELKRRVKEETGLSIRLVSRSPFFSKTIRKGKQGEYTIDWYMATLCKNPGKIKKGEDIARVGYLSTEELRILMDSGNCVHTHQEAFTHLFLEIKDIVDGGDVSYHLKPFVYLLK